METKELKIVAPDGYEIDRDNSTLERIVFKKKDYGKPRTWEDFCDEREDKQLQGFYIEGSSVRETYCAGCQCKSFIYSKEEAEAFLALMQLRQLREAWVGDWEPDWSTSCAYDDSYGLIYSYGVIIVEQTENNSPLSFPTEEMAKEFRECFKDLLEQAKMLL